MRTPEPHSAQPTALGPYLRMMREKAELSLRQLATQLGIHASYLGRIECGDYRQPSPEVLQKLSRALNIRYADLFALTGYRIPEELPNLSGYLRSRYHMSDHDIQKVTSYVDRLSRSRQLTDDSATADPANEQTGSTQNTDVSANNGWRGSNEDTTNN